VKVAVGLVFAFASSYVLAEDIPFLKGKATSVRSNSRTPVRIDPVEYDFLSGTLDTSKWDDISTSAGKNFEGRQFNSGYAYFEVKSDQEKPMFLEAKGHSMVYVNGEPRVGDIYSFGYVSLPVQLKKGKNTFLFSVARGSFSGKLVDVPKPISFNPGDQTTPDIVKGEKEKLWVALIVRNATEKDLDDLSIEAGGTTTKVGRVLGTSVRKVGFEVKPNATGKYTVNLKQGGKTVDSLPLALRVRDKRESHKRTFLSSIDGSIQYYGVQPSTTEGPNQALFLSLHGASVEGIGQAESYSPKSWGYIISPTNRRPYGFNWEDIGRLDALEVLELAKKRYQTDPSRTYLTGHSMGGHGTYHLGVLYPDKFAAIAPCSGWISYFSYAGGATYPDTPVGNVLKRAMATSDTLSMKSNYFTKPIFIMHGEADDNVPVTEARNMRKELEGHPNLYWHEEKGQGHWYDVDPEPGASCQDYAPIFDMFAKARIPKVNEVRDIDFKTPNLAVSNKCYWLTINAQEDAGSLSSVKATVFPGLRKYSVTCTNVTSFSLDLSPLAGQGKVTVEVNGRTISTKDPANGILNVDLTTNPETNQTKLTGFKSIFNNHVTLVLPTKGSKALLDWSRAKARYDAEQLWYIGNGSVDVITDQEYEKNERGYASRNILLYGDMKSNSVTNKMFLDDMLKSGLSDSIVFEARVEKGRVVGCIFGSEDASSKFADRVPLFTAGASIPDYLILKKDYLTQGLPSVKQTGFWDPK
jgi:pimeloyl-ACP methyl ester carboxylesterase